jgi:hypothetical protein
MIATSANAITARHNAISTIVNALCLRRAKRGLRF